jgi:hypothetical protein
MDKREEMALLMEEFTDSGQSQKEFSASRGIALPTFNYWFRKFKTEKAEKGEARGFSRVDTTAAPSSAGGQLELVYPNGVKLKTASSDLSLIAGLVRLY